MPHREAVGVLSISRRDASRSTPSTRSSRMMKAASAREIGRPNCSVSNLRYRSKSCRRSSFKRTEMTSFLRFLLRLDIILKLSPTVMLDCRRYGSVDSRQMQGESSWKAIHTAEESLSRETMKHSRTQPVARKNPDSPRVHGLRLTVNSSLRSGNQTGDSSEG